MISERPANRRARYRQGASMMSAIERPSSCRPFFRVLPICRNLSMAPSPALPKQRFVDGVQHAESVAAGSAGDMAFDPEAGSSQ
jgi:hypothetical protein